MSFFFQSTGTSHPFYIKKKQTQKNQQKIPHGNLINDKSGLLWVKTGGYLFYVRHNSLSGPWESCSEPSSSML